MELSLVRWGEEMIEELLITFLVTIYGGIALFLYREKHFMKKERNEIRKKLRFKIFFWIIDEWGGKLENIFIIGHAISKKYNYMIDFENIEEIKKNIDEEIDSGLNNVSESFKNNDVVNDLIKEIPEMNEKHFEYLIEHFNSFLLDLKDGTILLNKDEIVKLDGMTQLLYYDFYSKLDTIIDQGKSFFYTLRYSQEINDEQIKEIMLDLIKSGTICTMSMYHLLESVT